MAKNDEKYAYLNRLNTEQLEELLRMDMEMAEPGNEDVVFHILEVIEQREDEHPTGRIPDVDKAWAEFQEYYNIPEGVDASLYPCETEPDASSENPAEFSHPRRPRLHRWLKQGLVAVNFVASSENGTTFSLDIIRYTSADYLSGTQFEKDTENIEQYSNDQQTFYILSNVDTITATWSDGLIVEQITGNISDEYMKKIIDSIGGV